MAPLRERLDARGLRRRSQPRRSRRADDGRREYLNDYLTANSCSDVAPTTVEPARSYLREAYSALANAAWQRDTGYGWTMVSAEQMAAYVGAGECAPPLRAATGQARDHWGFASSPRNATGMSNADFGAQTARILDRLAAAIRDSGDVVDPEDPGSGACGAPGSDASAWSTSRTRGTTRTGARFGAGRRLPSGSDGAAVGPGGGSVGRDYDLAGDGLRCLRDERARGRVTLGSSSPQGAFSASPTGPWAARSLSPSPRAQPSCSTTATHARDATR